MVSLDRVADIIRTELGDAEVQVRDLTGGGDHLEALVVSPKFDGLSRWCNSISWSMGPYAANWHPKPSMLWPLKPIPQRNGQRRARSVRDFSPEFDDFF